MALPEIRLRKGQVVAVHFLDHVEGDTQPYRFIVYGELSVISPQSLVVDCWAHSDQQAPHDSNESRFTIVRSCIEKVVVLGERARGRV